MVMNDINTYVYSSSYANTWNLYGHVSESRCPKLQWPKDFAVMLEGCPWILKANSKPQLCINWQTEINSVVRNHVQPTETWRLLVMFRDVFSLPGVEARRLETWGKTWEWNVFTPWSLINSEFNPAKMMVGLEDRFLLGMDFFRLPKMIP